MADLYLQNPRGTSHRDADRRVLEDRREASEDALDRPPPRRAGTPTFAGQVYDGGSMPKTAPAWFLTHPVEFDCPDAEGQPCGQTADSSRSIPVIVLGKVPSVGDVLIAEMIGSKWVAEKSGKPKLRCRWTCGPYVQFDAPSGSGSGCKAALASIDVADDGTIAGATLLDGGSCYAVPHPAAKVKVDDPSQPGSGATLLATVGEVVTLTLTHAGKYDPHADPPGVLIAGPGGAGSQATATASVNPDGTLTLTLQGGGALYTIANPTVTIDPPPAGGIQATAVATAKPGVVTSLKLIGRGAGYVDNTPPALILLTVACDAWTTTLPLPAGYTRPFFGFAGPPDSPPPGSLPYCSWTGRATVDVPGAPNKDGPDCPDLDGATIWGAVYHSANAGWVLEVDLSVGYAPSDPLGPAPECLEVDSSTDQYTEGGPFRFMSASRCSGRPFTLIIPVGSDMRRSEPGSAIVWWRLGGGYDQGGADADPVFGNPTPMAFTFTLSEPPPSP